MPDTVAGLTRLPGVGKNTAGAIMAYVYDVPVVFVETNIRTVMIDAFFPGEPSVSDADIESCVEQTLDRERPREWYYALMDYGAMLKSQDNRLSQSTAYRKQTPLKGSVRELRGRLLDLFRHSSLRTDEIPRSYRDDPRYEPAIDGLLRDGLICHGENGLIGLTESVERS